MKFKFLLSSIYFIFSVALYPQEKSKTIIDEGTFIDQRDRQEYKWVKIGDQIWMAENLNFLKSKYYCYKSNKKNCEIFGKLYPWKQAIKACPSGWHLPDDSEWVKLTDFLGGEFRAGGIMKEPGTEYWKNTNAGTVDSCRFNALPGGYRDKNGYCYNLGIEAYFWSSTDADLFQKWIRSLKNAESSIQRSPANNRNSLSIRCVKNN